MAKRKIEIKPYHGRLTFSDILRLTVVILVALIIISGGLLYYSRTGGTLPQITLPQISLPEKTPTPVPEPTPTPVPTPEPEPEPEPKPTPEPEPEPEPEPFVLSALELSLADALSPSLPATLASKGANAIILDMKSDDGTLGFYTENPLIASFPAVLDQSEEDTSALKALLEGDIYAVARISAFKDHIVGNDGDYALLSNSGYHWTDADAIHWSNPTLQTTQQYLIQCISQTAALGFDEILLDNFGYPDRGQMGWIRNWEYYDRDNLHVVLNDFLADIQEVLQQYPDLTLSIRVPTEILDGTDERIGLTAETLNQYADTIWIDAKDEALYAQSGIELKNAPVLVGASSPATGGIPSATLSIPTF